MTIPEKIISLPVGAFMLIGGLNKFREPYISMFHDQISLSRLPFPALSKWAGELGEISVGVILLVLVVLWKKIPPAIADKAFYLANLLVMFIMCVAVYVQLHPNVPAEILPFGYKPPVTTLVTLLLAGLNIYLHRNNQREMAY